MASAGKVLIIVQNLPVPFDRRVWMEATTLRSAGYQVSVICPKGNQGKLKRSYEFIEGVHIYRYPAPPAAKGIVGYMFEFGYCWFMTMLLTLRVWLAQGFDVIHACNPPETYFALAAIYKLIGKRFIFDHHDLSPEMYVAKGGRKGGFLYRALLGLERLTFKTADVIITTNRSHKEIAVKRGAVSPDLIFIVRSGPDLERLRPVRPEPHLKNGHRYMVCYLGEMCPQDGVDYLLRSAHHIIEDFCREDVQFTFIGGGPAMPDMAKLAEDMGLPRKHVAFTGRVSDADLCRHLSSADVCVDPDPYTEWSNQSTMNKIIEYMAFGCPIVAFDLLENRYSAQDAAVFVEPNDERKMALAILALLDDPQRRKVMGTYGQTRVGEQLSWKHSAPRLLEAYLKASRLQKP